MKTMKTMTTGVVIIKSLPYAIHCNFNQSIINGKLFPVITSLTVKRFYRILSKSHP